MNQGHENSYRILGSSKRRISRSTALSGLLGFPLLIGAELILDVPGLSSFLPPTPAHAAPLPPPPPPPPPQSQSDTSDSIPLRSNIFEEIKRQNGAPPSKPALTDRIKESIAASKAAKAAKDAAAAANGTTNTPATDLFDALSKRIGDIRKQVSGEDDNSQRDTVAQDELRKEIAPHQAVSGETGESGLTIDASSLQKDTPYEIPSKHIYGADGENGSDGDLPPADPKHSGGFGGTGGAGVHVKTSAHVINRASITGGTGGTGGNETSKNDSYAGGGGSGGAGVVLSPGASFENYGHINGGRRGEDGRSSVGTILQPPRDAASEGVGVLLTGGNRLHNHADGQIRGGVYKQGEPGFPAIHVSGHNNHIINDGRIQSGNHDTLQQSDVAITIDGNDNSLELGTEYHLFGRVVAKGNGNSLILHEGPFDIMQAQQGTKNEAQFQGFTSLIKQGDGRLTLSSGSNDSTLVTPITVDGGILAMTIDSHLGRNDEKLTMKKGVLEISVMKGASSNISHPIDLVHSDNADIVFDIKETERASTTLVPFTMLRQTATPTARTAPATGQVILSGKIMGDGGFVKEGSGTLVLLGNTSGPYTGETHIKQGILQIGMDNEASGSLGTGKVIIAPNAKLNFNRSGEIELKNVFSGSGSIDIHGSDSADGSVKFTFLQDSSAFTGATRVLKKSTLNVSGKLGGTLEIDKKATLSGYGEVGNVVNKGTIQLADGSRHGTMTIAGNYEGAKGSKIILAAHLEGDNSLTDKLHIQGDAQGVSTVQVKNRNGAGSQTVNGIEIITVGGQSNAQFTLEGDYWLPESRTPAVIAGAYAYTLHKGVESDPANGNWYLRSQWQQQLQTPAADDTSLPNANDEAQHQHNPADTAPRPQVADSQAPADNRIFTPVTAATPARREALQPGITEPLTVDIAPAQAATASASPVQETAPPVQPIANAHGARTYVFSQGDKIPHELNGNVINTHLMSIRGEDNDRYETTTIHGNYKGETGSRIVIGAKLEGDASRADRLVIKGDATGESNVEIRRHAGSIGGQTRNGIEIISIEGRSDADFTLIGDYDLPNDAPAIVAGAYAYTLHKGGVNESNGNWYLRSQRALAEGRTPTPEVSPMAAPSATPVPENTASHQNHSNDPAAIGADTASTLARQDVIDIPETEGAQAAPVMPAIQPQPDAAPQIADAAVRDNAMHPSFVNIPMTSDATPQTVQPSDSRQGRVAQSSTDSLLRTQTQAPQQQPQETHDAPIYSPEVPPLAVTAVITSSTNTALSAKSHMSTGSWSGAGGAQLAGGDGPEGVLETAGNEILIGSSVIWGRIDGGHARSSLENSVVDTQFKTNSWNMRAGIDTQLWDHEKGKLLNSTWLQYGTSDARFASDAGDGRLHAGNYSIGTALTWFAENGFYVDGQAGFSLSRSTFFSDTLNRTIASNTGGYGYMLGIETGKRIQLDDYWSWMPQAQLNWSSTSLDDFVDPYHSTVSFDRIDNLTARLGSILQYANSWQDENGYTVRGKVYGLTNIYREMLGQSAFVDIGGDAIAVGHAERMKGELGLGGVYAFRDDKYSIFGEASASKGMERNWNSFAVQGNMGIRMSW